MSDDDYRYTILIKVIYIIALVILDSDLHLAFNFHDCMWRMCSNSYSLILDFKLAVAIISKDIQIKAYSEQMKKLTFLDKTQGSELNQEDTSKLEPNQRDFDVTEQATLVEEELGHLSTFGDFLLDHLQILTTAQCSHVQVTSTTST